MAGCWLAGRLTTKSLYTRGRRVLPKLNLTYQRLMSMQFCRSVNCLKKSAVGKCQMCLFLTWIFFFNFFPRIIVYFVLCVKRELGSYTRKFNPKKKFIFKNYMTKWPNALDVTKLGVDFIKLLSTRMSECFVWVSVVSVKNYISVHDTLKSQ